MQPMKPLDGMKPMTPMSPLDFGEPWWPAELGEPSTRGAQDGVRYAYFPHAERLLIEEGGLRSTYDTCGHDIEGVAQAQSQGRSLTFAGRDGPVDLGDLKRLG